MSYREIKLDAVERHRDRLFDRFGEKPVYQRTDAVDPDRFEQWLEGSENGYVGSAYALVRRWPEQQAPLSETLPVDGPERERVLLILGRGNTKWSLPGGGRETDEPFDRTVEREVREEVGIDIEPRTISHLRHDRIICEGYEERLNMLRVFFRADYVDGSITVQPSELNGAVWVVDPPDKDELHFGTKRALAGWSVGDGSSPETERGDAG